MVQWFKANIFLHKFPLRYFVTILYQRSSAYRSFTVSVLSSQARDVFTKGPKYRMKDNTMTIREWTKKRNND